MNLHVKIEAFSRIGRVKDRLALGATEDAERSGNLKPGQTVIEATSGDAASNWATHLPAAERPVRTDDD